MFGRSRRIFTQIFLSHFLVIVTLLLAVGTYADVTFRRIYLRQLEVDLQEIAFIIGNRLPRDSWASLSLPPHQLRHLPNEPSPTRITLILPDGKVLADSDQAAGEMDNHLDRPEIQGAFSGAFGSSIRFSHTLNENLLYTALPMLSESGNLLGVVRVARALSSIEQELWRLRIALVLGGLVIAVIAAALSYFLSRKLSRPLEEMKVAATKFAAGEITEKLSGQGVDELNALARALNRVGARVYEKMQDVIRQRNELDAVLASMVEAVVAIDIEDRILRMNPTAEKIFGVLISKVRGQTIQVALRHSAFEKLVAEVLDDEVDVRRDLTFYGERDLLVQGHGSMLRDSNGESIGVLVVLNDVTQLRYLEKVRIDFVANVSHELKTPVTSIKGFVETLLSGAMEQPEERLRFLMIIARQADRLQSIIESLLTLSQVEQLSERDEIRLERGSLRAIVDMARQVCETKAESKQIRVENLLDAALIGKVNPFLLEQALINLIENAIKYSDPNTSVSIEGEVQGQGIQLSVKDQGPGIPKNQLDRIFERFYRVDEGRSRKEGGSGLGLAIVKHIAQVHGGYASVRSTIGEGTVFSLHLQAWTE